MLCKAGTNHDESQSWPSTMCDEGLVACSQAGSQLAFVELFMRHQKKLSRVMQRITRNSHDTEDAVQDSCMMAFIHIKTFDSKSAFSTWLVRIGINTALMILRKRRRMVAVSLDEQVNLDHQSPWQIAAAANDPEKDLLDREKQYQVHQAVKRLPAPFRIVIEAQRFQEKPLKEVASMAGLTVAATKSRLYRARIALRRSIRSIQKESLDRHQSGRLDSGSA